MNPVSTSATVAHESADLANEPLLVRRIVHALFDAAALLCMPLLVVALLISAIGHRESAKASARDRGRRSERRAFTFVRGEGLG